MGSVLANSVEMMLTFLIFAQELVLVTSQDVGLKIVNRSPELCTTISGQPCVFPFIFQGVRYESCSFARSETAWCATEVNREGVVMTNRWGDCNLHAESSCQVESRQSQSVPRCVTVGGPSPGSACVFPFIHNGVVNTECTTEGLGQPW